MKKNLIPNFMMREAGIHMNDNTKTQVDNTSKEEHSMYFTESKFRITLSLWGT